MHTVPEDESEAKYFGHTEAYKSLQLHKLNPEEGFLERMKLRQKERERKRNEIRKFHQIRAEESRLVHWAGVYQGWDFGFGEVQRGLLYMSLSIWVLHTLNAGCIG